MESMPQIRVFENVIVTPNGKRAAVLEGRWDDIYATLINIRDDGRLVPYAHHPVQIGELHPFGVLLSSLTGPTVELDRLKET
jgi:hypothetical protein